jgi:hypothetical protein
MNTEDVERYLRGLSLGVKPLGELSFVKGVTLIVAALEAQRTGKMDPDHFYPFCLSYILRNDVEEVTDGPDDAGRHRAADEGVDEAGEAIRKLWAPHRERILAKSGEIWKN